MFSYFITYFRCIQASDWIVECRNKMLHLNIICKACLYIYSCCSVMVETAKPEGIKKLRIAKRMFTCKLLAWCEYET